MRLWYNYDLSQQWGCIFHHLIACSLKCYYLNAPFGSVNKYRPSRCSSLFLCFIFCGRSLPQSLIYSSRFHLVNAKHTSHLSSLTSNFAHWALKDLFRCDLLRRQKHFFSPLNLFFSLSASTSCPSEQTSMRCNITYLCTELNVRCLSFDDRSVELKRLRGMVLLS